MVPKISNGLPSLNMEIVFPTHDPIPKKNVDLQVDPWYFSKLNKNSQDQKYLNQIESERFLCWYFFSIYDLLQWVFFPFTIHLTCYLQYLNEIKWIRTHILWSHFITFIHFHQFSLKSWKNSFMMLYFDGLSYIFHHDTQQLIWMRKYHLSFLGNSFSLTPVPWSI